MSQQIPNCDNLQHLSQHVTFAQWAHQWTGLMFIIHPLSQEPKNLVGYGLMIKLNMQVPLAKMEFFVIIWNDFFNLIIFKTFIYIYILRNWKEDEKVLVTKR